MNRRQIVSAISALGALTTACTGKAQERVQARAPALQPPKGKILVAFLLSPDAQVIDFAGPWEVFQDVHVRSRGFSMDEQMPFSLLTVAESPEALDATGGLTIVPDRTFANVPQPNVIVIPAQSRPTPAAIEWLKKASAQADVTMSVCTGAFVLAAAGMLDGLSATTHFGAVSRLARDYPKIDVKRDVRFVENEKISTSAGLSAGIDLALRVVERYFGRGIAQATAEQMQYEGTSWKVA